nr:MAG: putative RNA-dependent RNA polymerase [Mitoviridae sp.]
MQNFKWLSTNEVRKVTRSNIASLFAALVHLMNVSEVVYKQRLMSIAGIFYNRILVLFDADARELISELKLVRRWFLEFIRGGDVSNPGIREERWDDTNACPFLLSDLAPFWDDIEDPANVHHLDFAAQVLYSLLSIDRIIVTPAQPNHNTITDPSTAKANGGPTDAELLAALERLNISPTAFKAQYTDQAHNFTWEVLSTRGPNGDATWTAHLDSRAWGQNSSLLLSLRAYLESSRLYSILRNLLGCIHSAAHEVIPNCNPLLGKLAYIEEWGGKSRIVAQLDYWTQMAMTPLHNTLNFFLKALPQDGTFNQHALADSVRKWTMDSALEIYCYDLTAATDRLPISLQKRILGILMSSTAFGNSWGDVLTGRDFMTNNGDLIRYAVGQPMGARSSFPMLALTHHVLIQIAAMRAELDSYTTYAVLGDDSGITNALVSEQYLLLMDAIGVPINLTKSITHVQDAVPMAEICKRVFMDGVEITRFNPKLIVNTIRDGRLGPDLQNDLFIRGWQFSDNIFWSFIAGLLDAENLTTLIKLNIAPIATTGLMHQYKPNTTLTNLGAWIPEYPGLKETHLVELFTYVAASEALKRLDSLLRATVTINDSLDILAAANARPDAIPQFVRDDWLRQDLSEEELARLSEILEGAGRITPNHPIVLASRAEANRISELLHSLNSMDASIVARARLGLLDIFRTSVSSIWLDSDFSPMGQNRALFHRMMTTLVSLFTSERRKDGKTRNLTLSYSVVLTTIGRLWSVSLTFGGTTSVNALKSSVTRNINKAPDVLSGILKDLIILPSTDAPQVQRPPASKRAVQRRRVLSSTKNSPLLERNL